MSVLKKVEEAYLGVLRFIIIFAASILLLGSVVFAVLSASNYGYLSKSVPDAKLDVKSNDVVEKVVAAKSASTANKSAPKSGAAIGEGPEVDSNEPLYERAAVAITKFVAANSKGIESLDKSAVLDVTRRKAKVFEDPEVVIAFAQGLAETMEKALADPKLLKLIEPGTSAQPVKAGESTPTTEEEAQEAPPARAFKVSPIEIVNETLNAYTRLFTQQLHEAEQAKSQALKAELEKKASAMTQLYVAGGAFGAFLFLVFISIVVKIERNLRHFASAQPLSPNTTLQD